MNAYNNLKHTFESKRIHKDIKIRVLNTYVKSIFMYNSKLWTLTKELEKEIDIFQRTLLRKILHIYWQDKVTNKELYTRANSTEWSHEIKRRRISWLGHLLRLPEETPAKQALREGLRKVKRPKGKPKLTWLGLITKELREIGHNTDIDSLIETANERDVWKGLMGCAMSREDV